MELRMDGKVAVVTGASKGIGLAITDALSREGARVVAGARHSSPDLERLDGVVTVKVDLATADGPARLVATAVEEMGGVDVLVNNVGSFAARTEGFAAVTDADWQRSLDINLFSAVRAIRAAIPSLIERRGAIINVSSARARVPQPPVIDYSASKAALTNLSRTLAEELGPKGVRVNTVSPGPTRTSAWEEPGGFGAALAQANGASLESFLEDFPAMAGLSTGRMTEPHEVAAIVLLLASGRIRGANGSDYLIDGGQAKAA
jgi:putative oxidoreductase